MTVKKIFQENVYVKEWDAVITDVVSADGTSADIYLDQTAFFPEGGGHALYDWDGPNVTNAAGMTALTRWVEEGKIPETLRTVNYDFMEERVTKESEVRRYSMSEGEGDGLRV